VTKAARQPTWPQAVPTERLLLTPGRRSPAGCRRRVEVGVGDARLELLGALRRADPCPGRFRRGGSCRRRSQIDAAAVPKRGPRPRRASCASRSLACWRGRRSSSTQSSCRRDRCWPCRGRLVAPCALPRWSPRRCCLTQPATASAATPTTSARPTRLTALRRWSVDARALRSRRGRVPVGCDVTPCRVVALVRAWGVGRDGHLCAPRSGRRNRRRWMRPLWPGPGGKTSVIRAISALAGGRSRELAPGRRDVRGAGPSGARAAGARHGRLRR
jgi:hypothetical protein